MMDQWNTDSAEMLRIKKKCIDSGAVANLIRLLQFDNRRKLENVLNALSHIADGDAECRSALITLGAIPKLIDLLYHEDHTIKSSASKVFWWLSIHGNLECKTACIKEGAIEGLEDCYKSMGNPKYMCYDSTYTREAMYALRIVNGGT
jgi:cbb3-type cytochrome oxidase subunit 1